MLSICQVRSNCDGSRARARYAIDDLGDSQMRRIALALLLALMAPLSLRALTPYLVKDINLTTSVSTQSSFPYLFFKYGSQVLFLATGLFTGTQVWSTDGTEAGTVQVSNINSGSNALGPSRFVPLNGKLLFNATDSRGEELWTTDGTKDGTRLVADINSGFRSSSPG